ncbi:MAG: hypothetical protein ACKOVB_09265 [Terrabacter sp.]
MGWLSRTFRSGDDTPAPAPVAPQGTSDSTAGQSGPPVPLAPHPVSEGAADRPADRAADGPDDAAAPTPTVAPQTSPTPPGGPSATTGRYGPLVSVTHFDTAPPELEWQLPLNGELYRLIPGSDRPDYSLFFLERPVHFYPGDGFDLGRVEPEQRVEDRKGRPMVRVHAMLLCARFVGQQLHPGMRDLAVNLAYVVDNSLARDAEVDFGKIEFAAVGFLSEGHAPRPENPATPHTATDADAAAATDMSETPDIPDTPYAVTDPLVESGGERDAGGVVSGPDDVPDDVLDQVLDEVAAVLRRGVEQQRGTPVHRLTAALTVDSDHRLTGLSGNADSQAPVPTPETFTRLAEVLARLGDLTGGADVAAFTVRVDGDVVSHEVTATR